MMTRVDCGGLVKTLPSEERRDRIFQKELQVLHLSEGHLDLEDLAINHAIGFSVYGTRGKLIDFFTRDKGHLHGSKLSVRAAILELNESITSAFGRGVQVKHLSHVFHSDNDHLSPFKIHRSPTRILVALRILNHFLDHWDELKAEVSVF